MSLLLYAITTPPRTELAPPLARIDVGTLTAWATVSDAEKLEREDALRHHEVVCAIFAHVDACLPARFPTLAADAEVLRQQLRQQAGHLAKQLETVRGACELAITAVWTSVAGSSSVEASTPGRQYLLRRQAELMASEQRRGVATDLAEQLERTAGSALRDAERRITPSKEVALSLALLVERHAADAVRERLAQYVTRDLRILVHGPWPPYTFVGRP